MFLVEKGYARAVQVSGGMAQDWLADGAMGTRYLYLQTLSGDLSVKRVGFGRLQMRLPLNAPDSVPTDMEELVSAVVKVR